MLCLTCKYKSDRIELSTEEFDEMKNTGLIPEDVEYNDFITALEQQREIMKKYYDVVVYCKLKKSLIVANPDRKTQTVDNCEQYEKTI